MPGLPISQGCPSSGPNDFGDGTKTRSRADDAGRRSRSRSTGARSRSPRRYTLPIPSVLRSLSRERLRGTDRVLDLGTGCGVNGSVAASKSHHGVAVDVNPIAVDCAKRNAERNGVAGRVEVRESDLFENVSGRFDLILFDPPFRWFRPNDLYERATADENCETLTSLFQQVKAYLTGSGRILLSFGTTGDIDYLHELVAQAGLKTEELRKVEGEKDGLTVAYLVYRFTVPSHPVSGCDSLALLASKEPLPRARSRGDEVR